MATAKRGRRRTVELANLPDVPETPDDGQGIPYLPVQTVTEERRERELEDILEDLGTDSRIRVWQIQDGKSSYAGEISAEGFTLDSLLETFGGGEKSLAIVQGKRVVEKTKVFLDPSVPAKNPRSPKGAAQPAAGGLGDVSGLIAAQAAQSMSMMQMVQGMMSMSQQSTSALVTAMTGMLAANNANKKDPTELALQIAQVLKGNDKGAGTTEMFAMLKEGISLGERLGGGDDDDDGVMGVVKEGVSILGNLVNGIVEDRKAKAAQARLQAGLPVVSHPTDSGVVPIGADPDRRADTPTTTDGMRPWVRAAAPHIGKLISAAGFLTPRAAADTLAERLGEDEFNDLLDDMYDQEGGGFGVRLVQYFPQVKDVDPEWIGAVIQTILTEYVDESDDAETPAPPTTNGGTP